MFDREPVSKLLVGIVDDLKTRESEQVYTFTRRILDWIHRKDMPKEPFWGMLMLLVDIPGSERALQYLIYDFDSCHEETSFSAYTIMLAMLKDKSEFHKYLDPHFVELKEIMTSPEEQRVLKNLLVAGTDDDE